MYPTAFSPIGVVIGLKMVEKTTKPSDNARFPLDFCDQAVEDAAIGIEAIRAKPTIIFSSSGGSVKIPLVLETVKAKIIGMHKFAARPTNSNPGFLTKSIISLVFTDKPALNKIRESINSGKESFTKELSNQTKFPSEKSLICIPKEGTGIDTK